MNTRPIISVIGSLSMDQIVTTHRLPDSGESLASTGFHLRCGGKGANTSVAAHRLSHNKPRNPTIATMTISETTAINHGPSATDIQVRLIGAIGDDGRGDTLVKALTQNGVDASGVRTVEGIATGTCICIIETDVGENRLLIVPGANLSLRPEDFTTLESLAGGERPDLVMCQLVIPRDTVEKVLETATAHGIDTLLNPSPAQYLLRPIYRMITHLVVNETEAAMMTDLPMEALKDDAGCATVTDQFLQMGVKNVVVTLGARGAYYSNQLGAGGHVEAEKNVNVLDVTGAGDTFTGAYAAEYVKQKQMGHWDMRKAVAYGCIASARTIQQIGAQEAIPWADEVVDLLSIEQQPPKSPTTINHQSVR